MESERHISVSFRDHFISGIISDLNHLESTVQITGKGFLLDLFLCLRLTLLRGLVVSSFSLFIITAFFLLFLFFDFFLRLEIC